MQNVVPFANAILLLSSVLSSVSSLPTQGFLTEVEEVAPISEEVSECFEPFEIRGDSRSSNEFALNSEGQLCFEALDEDVFPGLVRGTETDRVYENITRDFCPTWPRSKECLRDHLNSDRCTEDDKKIAELSESFNMAVVTAELLCNPIKAVSFLQLLKNMLNEGIWNCVDGVNFGETTEECLQKEYDQNREDNFQELGLILSCFKPGLRKCANGDPTKEVKLIQLWDDLEETLLQTHRDFWH